MWRRKKNEESTKDHGIIAYGSNGGNNACSTGRKCVGGKEKEGAVK